ncbi:MAG: serine hydroxymethyltransferase [Gemmatimonadetes bacterium]|nr:serine hydroxymethyltransferase [Gemmatimonadota bacterium]|tara:strand:+ start:1297 stop:2553 length:1257 start_codon:yes stop_codon:yes gene_type:complete
MMREQLARLRSLVDSQREYRDQCLNLIASENTPSPFVEGMIVEALNRRYGFYSGSDPDNQHYRGTKQVAELEKLAQETARDLFCAEHVDLRALSGNIAGIIAMFALGEPGDKVLEVQNAHRYAHKLATSNLRVDLEPIAVPWDGPSFNIDLDATLELIAEHRPKLVVIGSATFLFPQPVREIRDALDQHRPDAILVYDAAHVMGMIAGGRFQQPLAEGADVLITSTHKTLAGPQGGMLMTNDGDLFDQIGEATAPLVIANHHLARIPALAATFLEWKACGSAYADAIIANAKALAGALEARGLPIVGAEHGYTESHTVIPVVDAYGTGAEVAERLEACHIIAGGTGVPDEYGSHGLRIGVQEVTRYGMDEDDADAIAGCIVDAMAGESSVKERAIELANRFKTVRFTIDAEANGGERL